MGAKFKLSLGKPATRPGLHPKLPQPNPDWAERTASHWADHSNFLEKTGLTDISPPPLPQTGPRPEILLARQQARREKLTSFVRWTATIGVIAGGALMGVLYASGYFATTPTGAVNAVTKTEDPTPPNPHRVPSAAPVDEPTRQPASSPEQ